MSNLSQHHKPGILLVLAKPTSPHYLADFHNWYNTEHGPARLRLGTEYFSNGYRYKSGDKDTVWLAIYDMKSLSMGEDPAYYALRENRSRREQDMLARKVVVMLREFLQLEAVAGLSAGTPAKLCYVRFSLENTAAQTALSWYRRVCTVCSSTGSMLIWTRRYSQCFRASTTARGHVFSDSLMVPTETTITVPFSRSTTLIQTECITSVKPKNFWQTCSEGRCQTRRILL